MSLFGNDLYTQVQNQGFGNGSTFGNSHGTGGFGQGGLHSSGFGQQHWSGGGLGQGAFTNTAQPISIEGTHMYAHVGPPVLHKRKSLLSDMTQSKSGLKPVYITSCSFNGSSKEDEDVTVIGSIFDKPMEKKRPPLLRQSSMSSDSSGTRPPTFSSLGNRMRSNTVGAPGTMRSISLTEERTQPMNSDLPTLSQLKRRHSFHAQHKRRNSLFGRSNKSTPPLTPKSDRFRDRKRSSSTNSEKEHEALILSLMNPPTQWPGSRSKLEAFLRRRLSRDSRSRRSSRTNSVSSCSSQVSEKSNGKIAESPTLVSKKIQHLYPRVICDENSLHSANSSPRSARSVKSSRSLHSNKSAPVKAGMKQDEINPKTGPMHYKPSVNNRNLLVNQSDSENSEIFHDCANSDSKKVNKQNAGKQYLENQSRPRTDSTGTCSITDVESISSFGDSPRTVYKKRVKKTRNNIGKLDTDDEDEAFCVKELVDQFNKQHGMQNDCTLKSEKLQGKPSSKSQTNQLYPDIDKSEYENLHAEKTHSNPFTKLTTKIPDLVVPAYVVKAEPSLKDTNGHDTCADSSESGYTSNKQHSPRECEIKAAHFVNSLPHPQDRMKHASDNEVLSINSNLSSIGCESGSDSEDGIESQNRTIFKQFSKEEKVEATKELASPTLVKEMFDQNMARRTGNRKTQNESISLKSWHRDTENSTTENMYLLGATFDAPTVKSSPSRTTSQTKVNTVVNAVNGRNTETNLANEQSIRSFSDGSFERRMLSFEGLRKSQFPSIAQTYKSNRLDLLLHMLNVLLFLTSIGVIVGGIWLLKTDFNASQITEIFGNNVLKIIVYVSLAGAGIAMAAALCLCCGIRRDKFGLGFYACVLIIVVIAFSLASILSAIFVDSLNGIELRFNFQDKLIARYGNFSQSQTDNKDFTESWDSMQMQFECCGAHGTVNDTTSWAVYKKFSVWYRKQPLKATVFVPESCCVKDKNVAVCQGSDHNLLGPPVYGPPMDRVYGAVNPNINTKGCYDIVAPYLVTLVTYVAVIMGALAALYFLIAFLTWMFCLKNKNEFDDTYYSETDYGDYEYDANDEVFAKTNIEETDHECHSEFASRESELNRLMSNDSHSRTISEESQEESLETERTASLENETMNRRDRWYRSDVQMNNLFTLTIEEEDSDFEDNETDSGGANPDDTLAKKPI